MVIIVRRDCEHCQTLVSEFFGGANRHRSEERTIIFIAGETRWPFQFDQISMDADNGKFIEWPQEEPFVSSPAVFVLEVGYVQEAADGKNAATLCKSLLLGH